MSQLGSLIQTAANVVWANSEAELALLFRKAEDNVSAYTSSLINNPDMTPKAQGPSVRQKKAQENAKVLSTYLTAKKSQEYEAIASALLAYLQAHAKAVIIPGSMANQGGTVVSTSFVTKIVYPE